MSAACVRYIPETELAGPDLDTLHHRAVQRIEKIGDFWIGTTRLKGRTWFRACAVNYRTTDAHIDRLMALLERECLDIERDLVH